MSKIPPQLAENPSFLINQTAKDQGVWFDREMKALKLDRAQWRLLGYLNFFDSINQSELARILGIGKAPLGQMVHKLERMGMIVREPSSADKRSYNLRVADSHLRISSMIGELMTLESARSLMGLSEKDRTQLCKLLRRVRSNLFASPESEEVKALKREIVIEMGMVKKRKPPKKK